MTTDHDTPLDPYRRQLLAIGAGLGTALALPLAATLATPGDAVAATSSPHPKA